MATGRQASFVTDLAVQAGLLSVLDLSKCYEAVLDWDNEMVTNAVKILRPRIWRGRTPASRKQVVYGAALAARLAEVTGDAVPDLDFEVMSCQDAIDQITRLQATLDALDALEADPGLFTTAINIVVRTKSGTEEAALVDLFTTFASKASS